MKWLEKTIEEKSTNVVFLKPSAHNSFSEMAGDPRFQALIHKMDYPE